jgi:uncharacterized protein (DUF58 family)
VFSISVVPPRLSADRPAWRWQRSEFTYPSAGSGRKAILRCPDFAYRKVYPPRDVPPVFEQSVYLPYLPGGHRQSAELNLKFPRRGLYAQRGIGISTRFPFSFLTKTRMITLNQEVLVFPSVEATDEMFEVLPIITGEMETNQRGRGSDLYRIRDYVPEDSARHVDWKATAKSGELKVREYTREDERRVCLIFDNPPPGVLDHEHYERAINLAASLAWHFFEENTELSFAAPSLSGEADVYSFLEYLALAAPCPNAENDTDFLSTLGAAGQYNIIITACPRGLIPSALWQSSYVLFAQE